MHAEFSWAKVLRRRAALAKRLQNGLGLSFGLDGRKSFDAYDLGDVQLIGDQPLWRLPFFAVAQYMQEAARVVGAPAHVIDHAWWLVAKDRQGEPWGFVTEPYVSDGQAEAIAAKVALHCEDWGLSCTALPAKRSCWNPGSCPPIITLAGDGRFEALIREGLIATVSALTRGWRARERV